MLVFFFGARMQLKIASYIYFSHQRYTERCISCLRLFKWKNFSAALHCVAPDPLTPCMVFLFSSFYDNPKIINLYLWSLCVYLTRSTSISQPDDFFPIHLSLNTGRQHPKIIKLCETVRKGKRRGKSLDECILMDSFLLCLFNVHSAFRAFCAFTSCFECCFA